ncbi:hypothetical protein ACFPRL_26995 [Pseudoclavibacter helvolus]
MCGDNVDRSGHVMPPGLHEKSPAERRGWATVELRRGSDRILRRVGRTRRPPAGSFRDRRSPASTSRRGVPEGMARGLGDATSRATAGRRDPTPPHDHERHA